MNVTKGVFLAAGKGTRMLPLTERRPKPMVPVVDRPIIEHIMIGARNAGITEQLIIDGYLGEIIRQTYGDGTCLGIRLEYVEQTEQMGTGHAALLAEEFVGGKPFFMSWGDILVLPSNYKKVVDAWDEDKYEAVLSLNPVDDPYEGAAVYERDGLVTEIIEKPEKGTSTTNWNNAGLFVYKPDIFDRLRALPLSPRGEIELPLAVAQMLAEGKRICAVKLDEYWDDVARPSSVLKMNRVVMNTWGADEKIFIDPSATVAQSARLTGPVYIGRGCVVGENAIVGPNAVMMNNSVIGRDACFNDAVLFTGAALGEGTRVSRLIIEEGAKVGDEEELAGTESTPHVMQRNGVIQYKPA